MANILKSVWNSVKPYVPAIVGTVAGAYTGGTAGPLMALAGLGMSSSNEARKAQKDAEQRQFNYTQQLNAEMNAYNTPEAQMERYIKAGINPYMASVSSGTQGSAGSVSTSAAGGDAINRAFTIANAVEDIRSKTLANDSQEITNEYLPAQIKATIGEVLNRSELLKNQVLTSEINNNIIKHDWDIIKKSDSTTSKETGVWPRLDRLFRGFDNNFQKTGSYLLDRNGR